MTTSSQKLCVAGAIVFAGFHSSVAFAERSSRPALDARASAGYFTYKSKYAVSNDTGLRYDYAGTVYAGDSRNVGMSMRGNMMSSNFALVSKKLDVSSFDFVVSFLAGPFYIGPFFGMSTYKFTDAGATTFDLTERHYGGNVGFDFEVIRNGTLRVDALVTKMYDVKEVNDQKIDVGMRIEGDVSLNLRFSRSLAVVFGGKYLTYSLESKSEGLTMPYVGFRAELEF